MNGSVDSNDEFVSEHGEAVLRPMDEDKLDSNALWVLEKKSTVVGGAIHWKDDLVRLRHLNTG